jgi:nucleoside-diphosphate-sugar epimerase
MAFARLIDALATGRTFEVYGDGGQSRAFTFVADAVDATIAAMDRGAAGRVYNVGGGSEATVDDAIAALEYVAGRSLDVVRLPPAKGDVRRTAPDVSRTERELGWRARTTLEEGLAAQWEWTATRVAAR